MPTTPDATSEFFRALKTRGHDPLLGRASGTLRFDLAHDDRVEHWHVTVHGGDVTVSRKNVKADAVVKADKQLFDQIVSGRENAMAAVLRGAIEPQGDVALTLRFARLFPGPPSRVEPSESDRGRSSP
jgi:putative sterol carrier protein